MKESSWATKVFGIQNQIGPIRNTKQNNRILTYEYEADPDPEEPAPVRVDEGAGDHAREYHQEPWQTSLLVVYS